jgi:fibronectin-binding autotransporter adhesin
MTFLTSRGGRTRADRARLCAGVSLVAVAALLGGSNAAGAAPISGVVTISEQAGLDALESPIEIGTDGLLVFTNQAAATLNRPITIGGVGWQNPYGNFFKFGSGTLTIDNTTILGGETHIAQGGVAFSGNSRIDYLAVGEGASTTARMTIGDGASVSFGVGLAVGTFSGTGIVDQTGGLVKVSPTCGIAASCASFNLGNQGGTGTYNISGGTLQLVGGLHSIGRNAGNNAAGSGTLNISGDGLVVLENYPVIDVGDSDYNPASIIIGDRSLGGLANAESNGEINQTGGTFRVGAGTNLFLRGYGDGTYNLSGGVLEIGGASLKGAYAPGADSTYEFNLGGGMIRVTDDLVTDVDATLVSGTLSAIDTDGYDANWSGSLAGTGGLEKLGEGTLTIGNLSNDVGLLVVSGGDLKLTGSKNFQNATTVAAIAGSTIEVAGDFTLGSTGRFVVGINDLGEAGKIAASGNLVLDGAVQVVPVSGYLLDHDYVIASADGTASFANSTPVEDLAFIGASLREDDDEILLTLTRDELFATEAQTANQEAAANGLDSVSGPSALVDAVQMLTAAEAPAAFDAISGEIHAASASALLNESFFLRDAVLGRLQYPSRAAAPTASLVSGYAEGDKRSAALFPGAPAPAVDPNTFWTQAYGSWGHSDGNGNAAKLDRSTGGILVGYDHSFGQDWLIGAAAGYSRTSFDLDDRASSGDSDNYHLLAYAGGTFAAVNVRLGASYSWNDVDTTRNVALPGFYEQVKADYSAGTTQLFGELSHDFAVTPATTIEPFAGLAYVHLSTDGYSETGGSAALGVDGSNQSVTYGTLGVRADHKLVVGGVGVTLQGAAAWQHAWGDVTPVSTLAFAGGDAFQVTGAPIAEDALLLKAGFDVDVTAGAKFGLFYAGQLASDAADNSIQGRFSVAF